MQYEITNQNLGALLNLALEGTLSLPEGQRLAVQGVAHNLTKAVQDALNLVSTPSEIENDTRPE